MPDTDRPRIVVVMCLSHKRYPGNLNAVHSLQGQIDTLYLCLSDFPEVPSELNQSWICILHSGAELSGMDVKCLNLLKAKQTVDAHVLVCDDNLIYPFSYVEDFLIQHKEYPDALLTYHGYNSYYPATGIARYEKSVGYKKEQSEIRHVEMPGAGVSFIPQSVFSRMQFPLSSPSLGHASFHLACICLKLNIPVIGIPHKWNYLTTIDLNNLSDWVNLHVKFDWMDRVVETYQSYGLNFATLNRAAPDLFKPDLEFKVTTVLNVYKRTEYLAEQIEALRNQTVPTDIWIDYTVPENEEMENISEMTSEAKLTIHVNQNLYYIGRFYYALNVPTEYVFICDDDIIPGKNYIQHCIDTMEEIGDCVLTGHGIKLKSGTRSYVLEENMQIHGWSKGPDQMQTSPVRVDMGGQSWFMKKKHLSCIVGEDPPTRLTGEDLHFSYCLQKYAGIPIYVPPHVAGEYDNWSCQYEKGVLYGGDIHASCTKPGFYPLRSLMVAHYAERGWKLSDDDEN